MRQFSPWQAPDRIDAPLAKEPMVSCCWSLPREIDAQPAMSDRGAGVVNLSAPRAAVAYNFGPNG